jgi:hypothetical protein
VLITSTTVVSLETELFPDFGSVSFASTDEPWKVEDRGEKPAIALKGR